MSDLPQDSEQDPSTATMHPALQAFKDAIPESAAEAPWAQEVTTRLNDWVQKRDMADANEAAANQYTANIGDFKSGLVNMVTADPTAHGVALDIVDPTLHSLMPYDWMHPDTHDATHSALSDDIKYQIAHASVAEMARRDGPAARSLMDSPAIAEHLDDQDKAGLSGYIQAHEVARGIDAAAGQREAIQQARRVQEATANDYAVSMVNPQTGQAQFPPGWAQKLTDDPNVSPTDRGMLMHMNGRLQADGDGASHPQVLMQALQDIAQGRQNGGSLATTADTLFDHVGDKDSRLSLYDATWLNQMRADETVQGKVQTQQLADTMAQSAQLIMGKDGERGPAGFNAFSKFVDWFIPAYQKAGPEGLNPSSDKYLFNGTNISSFKPGGDDLVLGRRAPADGFNTPPVGYNERRSLTEIFGGNKLTPPAKMPSTDYGPDKSTPFYKNPERDT